MLEAPTEAAIRDELQRLVVADLHGPLGGEDEEFLSSENPIDRYPLGRLAPKNQTIDPNIQEDLAEADGADTSDPDPEPSSPNVPSLNPSAMGFTAHVLDDVVQLRVTARWARYEQVRSEREDTAGRLVWKRVQAGGTVPVPLVAEGDFEPTAPDPDQPDVVVRGRIRRVEGNWLVSLFLENQQSQPDKKRHAPSWIFQVELAAESPTGAAAFLPRPDRDRGSDAEDRAEQRRLAMAYRFHPEFATGSGTAVHATISGDNPMRATKIRTRSMPEYEIPATDVPRPDTDPDLPELAELELGMNRLADLAEAGAEPLTAVLEPLVSGYRSWIKRNLAAIEETDQHLDEFAETARDNLAVAGAAADRIEAGIRSLHDDTARRAFAFANRAMHFQRLHTQIAAKRRVEPGRGLDDIAAEVTAADTPRWRPFQLAFVLLNLPALANPQHPERSGTREQSIADLLWFPTGGGKTEAYLGLTAFTIAVRRLQPSYGDLDAHGGVAVLMRYTLRLLTIQQFERATTLICAAENLRCEDPETWGEKPFRIGLWVGARVTPNKTDKAETWLKELKRQRGRTGRGQGSPHQLTSCPWCGSAIEPGRDISVDVKTYRRTRVICPDVFCPFGTVLSVEGLPILVVDEEIYRHPPALLIGTVDKFAQLPWQGETATLFGAVSKQCERHGYVTEDIAATDWESTRHPATNDAPAARTVGCTRLRPPELIIQDELHLITGPLGSLVGLYESAVDRLASWRDPETGRMVRPKVVASTATVRRANRQIGSLFDRQTQVFPPAGLTAADNFFARQRDTAKQPGRRYVGICAHGTRIKSTMIRVYVSVLGAAQRLHDKYGRNPITDPYMTLVGYFNSLRDLGGMRRLADDDVSSRLKRADARGLTKRFDLEIRELTSRLSSDEIRPLLDRLSVAFPRRRDTPRPIDLLLATNMIAVGVDVSRLGVMVVCNQPKSTAEYIQATSRVGRAAPGLVFTVYNWARPRDLSHYEGFEHFHATAYRHVEALSVTPFAERAVDRGLTGVLVSLVRGRNLAHNGNLRAQDFDRDSEVADHIVGYLKRRAQDASRERAIGQRVETELEDRLRHWNQQRSISGRRLAYSKPPKADDIAGLLHHPSEGAWRQTTCPNSLRDVEPAIPLLLRPTDTDTAEPPFRPPSNDEE